MTGRHTVPTGQVPTSATPSPQAQPEREAGARTTQPKQAASGQEDFRIWLPRVLMLTNIILLGLLAFQLTHRPKYEYMTVGPSDITFKAEMDNYGAAGWKTESCRRASDGSDYSPTMSYECIMSRPKLGW
ncbi:hypothetical protein [Deinococcus arcticus]|uniref:DUF4177 domain-containing protein n=1 Tax=Deinococcus arcticus TaxID=2136176 RepID=A0A2T3W615_9DEIO|nr:hypothetical protein [Deinococcus arcticus]PTA67328.1 hypothetical protein C8263_13605 [Deinococcus arcticus]